jgi:hypothetical protein
MSLKSFLDKPDTWMDNITMCDVGFRVLHLTGNAF